MTARPSGRANGAPPSANGENSRDASGSAASQITWSASSQITSEHVHRLSIDFLKQLV